MKNIIIVCAVSAIYIFPTKGMADDFHILNFKNGIVVTYHDSDISSRHDYVEVTPKGERRDQAKELTKNDLYLPESDDEIWKEWSEKMSHISNCVECYPEKEGRDYGFCERCGK